MKLSELEFEERINLIQHTHKRLNYSLFRGELKPIYMDIQNINNALYGYSETYDRYACFVRDYSHTGKPAILMDVAYIEEIEELRYQREQMRKLGASILHEMTHQYCFENGIDDRNHNELWADVALRHGLYTFYRNGESCIHDVLDKSAAEIVNRIRIAAFKKGDRTQCRR